MDNLDHDNAEVLDSAVDLVKGLRESVITKAKRKKAQKISDAGGYFTLTPYQKSLITAPAYAQKQMQDAKTSPDEIKAAEGLPPSEGAAAKKLLPYIAGAAVIGLIIYFIVKR